HGSRIDHFRLRLVNSSPDPMGASGAAPTSDPGPSDRTYFSRTMPIRLPPGDLFLLDRALPPPEMREFLRLNHDGGQGTEVLFSRQELAQNYVDALPDQGWEITAMTRQDVLVFLEESYARGGGTGATGAYLPHPGRFGGRLDMKKCYGRPHRPSKACRLQEL